MIRAFSESGTRLDLLVREGDEDVLLHARGRGHMLLGVVEPVVAFL